MTAQLGRGRQPLVAARRRPRRPPRRRGGPRALAAGARRPAERGRLHRRRHRGRQPRRQGPVLGPPRRGPAPHAASWPAPSSTTPSSTRAQWLAEHEGAAGRVAAGRPPRPGPPRGAASAPSPTTPTRSRWSRSCGPTTRSAPCSRSPSWPTSPHEYGVPLHSDAVQAVGQLPVDFAASGLDAMTVTGHKIGGPLGVGALLLGRALAPDAGAARRRPGARRALRHARRPGHRRLRGRRRGRRQAPARARRAPRRAARRPGRRVARRRPGRRPRRRPRPVAADRLPGNAHFSFPGCEGDALLLLLDARGIECSTGSACSAGVPQPSHVLLAMGIARGPRPRLAAVLARPHLHGGRRRRGRRGDRPGRRARPAGRPERRTRDRHERSLRSTAGTRMRVLAAMSGGVDSAVAAARARRRRPRRHRRAPRAVRATRSPSAPARAAAAPSRTPATPAGPPTCIGIPFYVWDLAERFRADVVDDFVAEYAAGRTPNPCLRCNEKIKFAAVLDKALALGFDAVCTGHYARIVDGRLLRAVDAGKDQSYVLGVLTAEQLARAMFPLGASTKDEVRRGGGARGLAVAAKPDSHDICFIADGDTAGFLRDRLGPAPGPIVDAPASSVGDHDGAYAFTVGQRRGPAHRPPGRRRPAALRPRRLAGDQHRHGGRRRGRSTSTALTAIRPRWCGPAPTRPVECLAQVRAHGEAVPAVACGAPATTCRSSCAGRCAASPPARRSCSTTATASSGRRPSPRPADRRPARLPATDATVTR